MWAANRARWVLNNPFRESRKREAQGWEGEKKHKDLEGGREGMEGEREGERERERRNRKT